MKLGFVVNPIAGMGGRVGLKGTDGVEVLERARSLGAIPESPGKAKKALEALVSVKDKIELFTYPGEMGENEARIGPEYTEEAEKKMLEEGVDLIIFAGGDGTARNIHNAVGTKVPVIGIPAGVKIHSGVYASHPRAAGEIALKFLQDDEMELKETEVMDIDEEAFREGVVTARLYGYMNVPLEPALVQFQKSGAIESDEEAIDGVTINIIEEMEDDVVYLIGSGTSTRPIMEELELPNTLLGIDIVENKKLVASDVTEKEILDYIEGKKAKIIVTIIGGQGYIFGRGNQQLSAEVIKKVGKENIIIISTKNKLLSLDGRPLLVDTGNDEVNQMFNGYIRVLINYQTESVQEIKGL